MDAYSKLAYEIIREQETIIGPIAIEQALKVPGLSMDPNNKQEIAMKGNKKEILENLVKQYEMLFGKTSIEVCREAVHETKTTISKDDLPDILK